MVIGTEMDKFKVESALRECLLTDKEMKLGPKGWANMDDPFKQAWDRSEEEEAHHHDHDHSHNGHAHHRPNMHQQKV